MKVDPDELDNLDPEDLAELEYLLSQEPIWSPLKGPQEMAYESPAHVVGYGGAAGGGKTDLAIGLALTQHRRIGIFRQNGTELTAIVDRIGEILGSRDGYNGQERIWRLKRPDGISVQIELGSFPNPSDEAKYRGRPHDLLIFDEASEMRATAPEFLMGWLRTTDMDQRCRVLMCFNPPTTVEGRWVIDYFAPWLDKKYSNPAQPGELRWFAVIDGKSREVESSDAFMHNGERIEPTSRTFIPSRISDNPHLMGTGYMRQLQAMPEPLRSQLLYGDFQAGVEDDVYQVIPTAHVEAAMARWKKPDKMPEMHSIGVDVAMGGRDETVIARRHGWWFDVPIVHSGKDCIDGPTIAGFIVARKRDQAVIHIDLFGVGAQPFGALSHLQQQVIGVNVGDPADDVGAEGQLRFRNMRTQLWWKMREALEPVNAEKTGIALPPDKRLLADLCTPKWKIVGGVLQVESREDIVKKLGRSPDYGSAYVLALIPTPKFGAVRAIGLRNRKPEYDPYRNI